MRILFYSQVNGRLSAAAIQEADVEVHADGTETLSLYDAIPQSDGGGYFTVENLPSGQGRSFMVPLVTQGYLDLTVFTVNEYGRESLYPSDEDEESSDNGDE